jgi:predicted RNase H-like nuclease (RuvC/YqgF family)
VSEYEDKFKHIDYRLDQLDNSIQLVCSKMDRAIDKLEQNLTRRQSDLDALGDVLRRLDNRVTFLEAQGQTHKAVWGVVFGLGGLAMGLVTMLWRFFSG